MSDFQDFLDNTLSNIKIIEEDEDTKQDEYNIYKDISTQLITMRNEAKMTQKELAMKCGLTQANISNIEKGISKPTIDSLKRIAEALGKRLRIKFEDREELI